MSKGGNCRYIISTPPFDDIKINYMKKILLIEDNNNIRENTAEILELANYKVFTAEDGKKGVEVAFLEKPDLVICDIMMPVLDGYGVLHLLRKNNNTRSTPLIFLTAKTEKSDLRKGMELGADDYIMKPFSETELLNAVEVRLKKADTIKADISTALDSGSGNAVQQVTEKEALSLLTENRNVNKYKKRQVIYFEGNHPSRLFYIQKGRIKTYKTNEDGKELVVGLYNEGDFLGYVALLEGTTYKEMAEAMDDVELAVIPREEFDELLNSNKEVARKFMALLAERITEQEAHLLGLAYNSLRKKVADTLVMLHKKFSSNINIGRENLANIAGTATESLIRTLGDFKNEKLIEIEEGVITILNEKKLEQLIN